MANSGRNTNGSQFFLVFGESPFAPNYTIFGHTDDAGVAVLAAMAAQGTDASESPTAGRPNADTKITAVAVG
jgi:peptidyl-prolyl cis-trans isomerase B (cyclophilin B)